MSSQSSLKLNLIQNKEDFELELLLRQALIFKLSYIKKTLDPPKANLEDLNNYRIVTISCLFKGYK